MGLQRPHRRRPAGKGGRTGQHRLTDRAFHRQGAAMAGRGGQPWAQRLELVVQALLEDLAVGDQPAPVADRSQQAIHGPVGGWPTGALADQPDQRRTSRSSVLDRRQPSWALACGRSGKPPA
jgi:hypothetical protein